VCSFAVKVRDRLAGVEGREHLVTALAGGQEVAPDVLDDVSAAST
jgi:hypothetical protein